MASEGAQQHSFLTHVFVSGLPLFWRGCNGRYTLQRRYNGKQKNVYVMPSHSRCGPICSRPMVIKYCKKYKNWVLLTDDSSKLKISEGPIQNTADDPFPFCNWTNCTVSAVCNTQNDEYFFIIIFLLVVLIAISILKN